MLKAANRDPRHPMSPENNSIPSADSITHVRQRLRDASVACGMRSLSWPAFLKNFPHGHLVAAVAVDVGADEIGSRRLRDLRDLLHRIIGRRASSGVFALTVSRAAGFPEILCGFEAQTDADALAAMTHAKPTDRYPGFATQRLFGLDTAMEAAIRAGLLSEGDIDQR
ncbi:hypothetical protein [Reyranella sp.]|uniref:hypothetical protein n=1 Tax=Reyranella sp. TaxID=1929291 RepID=UPI003D0BC55C